MQTTQQKQKEKEQAIKFYKAISEGKVKGAKIRQPKSIKGGSITFVIDGAIILTLE